MNLFDTALIKKYDQSGPRYTSYPTANNFSQFSIEDYQKQASLSNERKNPISLYCHIPFCDTVCFYCGCNKVVTKDKGKAEPNINQNLQKTAYLASPHIAGHSVDAKFMEVSWFMKLYVIF